MKIVPAYKAQGTGGETTEGAQIVIDSELPQFTTLEAWDALAAEQGIKLEEALYSSLPGGVYDRLLGEMLKRKSTHFRVSHNA